MASLKTVPSLHRFPQKRIRFLSGVPIAVQVMVWLSDLDSYRFIRKQEYFNKFMQLVGVGGCFGWSGRLYGRPIRVCCWAVVLQRVDGERGCWRGARRVVCERE